MNSPDSSPASAVPAPWWARLHAALMPDYNRTATLYWWSVVALGALTIAFAVWSVATRLSPGATLQVAIGVLVAMLAGVFPVRVPRSKNSFAAGEVFIFSLLLLHGPAAATLASAAEGLVGSWRTSKRWTSRIASPAMAAVSMFCAASLLEFGLAALRGRGWDGAVLLLAATTLFALVYFVLNTLLVTLVSKLKRNERLALSELFGNFGWIGIAYSGSASVAALVYLSYQQSGVGVLLAAIPIIALLLSTMHLYFRQQEADEEVRRGRLDAMEREQEQAQRHMQELQRIAFHDSLTGLPNRRQFHELLGQALRRVAQDRDQQFGVLFLDFDRFKLINDSLGHSVGDEFLVQVSQRLQQHVRPNDVVARLGGDEFAILVEGHSCIDDAVVLAERLLHMLRQPLRVDGTEINATASIGITSSAIAYSEPGEVLRDADIAMYRAKASGKARFALFDVGLRTEISQRLMLEGELRAALAQGQLDVEYQPLFKLSTGALIGFEALARWQHPRLGAISPATFIPIAEESGLIIGLTDFVLRQACHQLKRCQESLAGGDMLTMHVNISGNDIAHPAFVARVTLALAEAQLKPHDLTLELTENILMSRLADALPMLTELHALGVRLSVDDFGTGSSSLSHLSRLPFDSLKIDRSFVHELSRGSNTAIVNAIVFLAHALGKKVIAEGIETLGQFEQLCALGCESGQGYHMAPSMSSERVEAMLLGWSAAAPQVATGKASMLAH
ncbi:putative signaling protein [Burkholderiaceae bacterium]|nr:putative signaling protein [Burkholderiaceae bacterium]